MMGQIKGRLTLHRGHSLALHHLTAFIILFKQTLPIVLQDLLDDRG